MTADKTEAEPGKSLVSGKSGKSAFSVHAKKVIGLKSMELRIHC